MSRVLYNGTWLAKTLQQCRMVFNHAANKYIFSRRLNVRSDMLLSTVWMTLAGNIINGKR